MIPGFTFSLGFSGGHYGHGSAIGRRGDAELLSHARYFKWFCHTWSHSQPHLLSESDLLDQLMKNKKFATVHNLPIQEGYAVAPHHSGVYPVLPSLFKAWKEVWRINVTTTEGYPRLFPAWNRRGFAYDGIQVIPRQTCGVYTQTLRLKDYSGGPHRLQEMALGGEVFQTLLYTPVSFFMTHFGNYGQDRLATYVLSGAFRFLLAWTHLQLRTGSPEFLTQQHLAFHRRTEAPTSASAGLPLMSNPCADRRHAEIWPPSNPCDPDLLPSAIIGGPQKTGTTALLTFMAAHPNLVANRIRSQGTFEEPQFFSNNHIYAKGVAWYFDQFPRTPEELARLNKSFGERQLIRFEKSATYFDSFLAPDRVLALLSSRAKLIFLLKDPLQRAYSWYQHQRSHREEAALHFTFAEVLRASGPEQAASLVRQQRLASGGDAGTNNSSSALAARLLALNRRCLQPGTYAPFIDQWLLRFPPHQILLLDADQLVSAPAVLMDRVQEFLNVESYVNYSTLFQFNERKRFFCLSGGPYPAAGRLLHWDQESGLWCLSRNKGRSYPPLMPTEDDKRIFQRPMQDLYQLILQRQFWRPRNSTSVLDIIPPWLQRWIRPVGS
uniref:[heparan sulfate]-glucosamine N-sulfotransferase n=1 Tax=Schistocephalus solidus TaxID=70667 RepID=A0A0X3P2D7_SCHSO